MSFLSLAWRSMRAGQMFRVILCLVLFILVSSAASAQSRVFYDGAETPAAWAVNNCTAVGAAADGGTPAAGSRMWRCAWNGTLHWTDPGKLRDMAVSFAYTREFLVRFRRRYDANVDWTVGSKEWRVSFESTGELYGACQREKGANAADLFLTGNMLPSHWGGGPLCGTGWGEVAVYRRDAVNGAGGITRVWQDGRLVKEWTGNTGGHGGGLNLPSNWSSNPGWIHDALNYIYFDEVEVYADTSAGTPATGRLDDNSARAGSGAPPPPPPPPDDDDDPPPPPAPVPAIVGRFASQAPYTSGGVSGLRVTLRVPATQALPAVGRSVILSLPVEGGTSTSAGKVRSVKAKAYSGGDGQVVLELPGVQAIGLKFLLP